MTINITRSSTAITLYLKKSFRTREGKITSKIVEKLGSVDELQKKLGPNVDVMQWAKDYARERTKAEKEGRKKIIVEYDPNKQITMDKDNTFNVGYLFLQKCYYELGLDKICKAISDRHSFEYNLNEILSRLIYCRILDPASKLSTFEQCKKFIEPCKFDIHQIYRALEVLCEESDYIQKEVFKNSLKVTNRNTGVIYYDCTNFFFEIEDAEGLKQYGFSKENRPNPIVQMGLFMDADGMPLSFCINPGNTNEQITMRPLEQKLQEDFGLSKIVVCTDAGLSSTENRKYNSVGNRAFITTQSIKKQKSFIDEWILGRDGWRCGNSDTIYSLDDIDETRDCNKIFYKERWINENGLEQRMIVTYSVKYKKYQQGRRYEQIDRALHSIDSKGVKCLESGRSTDYKRLIKQDRYTNEGELATISSVYIDNDKVDNEAKYDGLYAVCTNLEDDVMSIIEINKWRWQIEDCFRIMKSEFKARPVFLKRDDRIKAHFLTCFLALLLYKYLDKKLNSTVTITRLVETLNEMNLSLKDGFGYTTAYTRTQETDILHNFIGFHTDMEITTKQTMKKYIRQTRNA